MSCERNANKVGRKAGVAAGIPAVASKFNQAAMTRRLKIQESADAYQLRFNGASSKPIIRLQGKWLEEAGFQASKYAVVKVEHGKLTITVE